jgi:hypothetical protein
VTFYLDTKPNFIDPLFAIAIGKFYKIKTKPDDDPMRAINNDKNSMGIVFKNYANTLYLKNKYPNIRTITNLYFEYLTIISKLDSAIVTFNQIRVELPTVLVLAKHDDILKPIIKELFPNNKVKIVDRVDFLTNEKSIILYISAEYSKELDALSKKYKFLIIDVPKDVDSNGLIRLKYPELRYSKMDISNIVSNIITLNIHKLVNTYQFTRTLICNKDADIHNFTKSLFENIENVRMSDLDKYYKMPMEFLSPELIINFSIIPIHKDVENYFRKLGIIMNIKDPMCKNVAGTLQCEPICKNVIGTIKCQPDVLWQNRFRLLGLV